MRIFRFAFALICFAIASPILCTAQDQGYIITMEADTVRGILQTSKAQQSSIKFKPEGGQVFTEYTARQIKGYGIENVVFKSRGVLIDNKEQIVFLRVIADGPTTLYGALNPIANATYFIQKPESPVMPLFRDYYKGTLAATLNNCASLKIAADGRNLPAYTATALSEFVAKYNSCTYPGQTTNINLAHNRINVGYGARAGFISSRLTLESSLPEDVYTFEPDNKLMAGLFMNISMEGKRLSIQPEVSFVKHSFVSYYNYEHPHAMDYELKYTYTATYLQAPLLLKYTFGNARVKPFLNAGPSISFILSNDASQTITYETGQATHTTYTKDNRVVGYLGGAGINFEIINKRQLFMEARYSRDLSNNNTENRRSVINSLQLSAGIIL
ncbi:porin family protein [Pontibacter vulgaris]|uniref:porin family protein n=1 Tax=Pontibacter vulgaris TaxID=2905679 RepID=UPI001FA70C29|nr:porin family protein [Pontibacter vulgaris]